MHTILIGTKNPHKTVKLSGIVRDFFIPVVRPDIPDIEESGVSFSEIAENKAVQYSTIYAGLAIATDGGAIIPALSEWEPIRTKRFGSTDQERVKKLLRMMEGKQDRRVKWCECLAVADRGKLLFTSEAWAMEGTIDTTFKPQNYREGIWLCSISSFPFFGGRNFFELTEDEQHQTEDSWGKLKESFGAYILSKQRAVE